MSIPSAFIVPHPPLIVAEVGQGREREVSATIESYHTVARRIGELKPETILLISPHAPAYADYIRIAGGAGATGNLNQFGAPQTYQVGYDVPLIEELCRLCVEEDFPAGTQGRRDDGLDHGTLVPMHFINQYYADYQLLRCSVSGLSRQQHYRFGTLARQAAKNLGRRLVIVASGDLSHRLTADGPYGFAEAGPQLDAQLVEIMKSGQLDDFLNVDEALVKAGAECGLNAFIVMAGVMAGRKVEPEFFSYEGTLGVGYALAAFWDKGESVHVRLARDTVESYVLNGKLPPLPGDLPAALTEEEAGVFVSLKLRGELRGCIGTICPTTENIAEEIRQNAVSAATRDPRFKPVAIKELPELIYSVDVLSAAEPCAREDLDVERYGVIVSRGGRRGLLLPNLEGVDTVEQQLKIACYKAGIDPNGPYELERFEVVRHQ